MKEDWNILSLGDCFEYIRNGANIKQEKGAGGIPITRIETLAGGVFNRDRLGYADIKSSEKYASYILESGDLLFSHINSKAYIGRTVLYEKEGGEIIIHGMNLLRMKVIPDVVIPKFIFYSFKSQYFREQVASYRKDAVNQSSISVGDLKKIQIAVPSISTQRRIVAELDLLSGIIEKKNAQLRTLDELANTIFYEMFGNPVLNDKAWASEKMKDIAPQKAYSGHIPTNNGMQWLLNLDMVESKTGKIIEKVLFSSADIGNSTTTFNEDNILYSKLRPYLNKVVIPDEPGYCTSELVPLLPKKGVINRIFLAYLLRSKFFVDYINTRVAGAKMPRVTMSDFWGFDIIIPPLKLQESFAEKISAIEKQKSLIRTSLSPAENLLAARMDKYFC